jgi:hypothetical protein
LSGEKIKGRHENNFISKQIDPVASTVRIDISAVRSSEMDWQISAVAATNGRTVTVFGGTGFLGRRIVRHLGHCEFAVRIVKASGPGGAGRLVLMIRNHNRMR